MSTVKGSPVQIKPKEKTRLEIFISYASEDRPFVHTLVEELKVPFSILLHFFVDDRSIESGEEWKRAITDRLDTADLLFIVSTGRQRESHDFPGFEIGYFSRSIKERPSAAGIKRQIIPLIIGGAIPGTVLDIQGIVIERKDIYNFEIPTENLSSETRFLDAIPADNPFKRKR